MSQKAQLLSAQDIEGALEHLPGWTVAAGKLHRTFEFRDFNEAFGFMTRAALVAERIDHHPEWFNVYRTVRVDLVTHASGGITERDTTLAQQLNALAGE